MRRANYFDNLYMPNCNGWPVDIAPILPANASSLTLFPNPATTILQLQGLAGGPLTYRISDVSGRSILAGKCADNTLEIAMLPAGFYLLTVQENNGRLHNRKFVKN